MIFNNLQKRSLDNRNAVQLQGLSTANHRNSLPDAGEDLQTLELEDVPHRNGTVFRDDDFVFLSDNVNCWVVRASDISVLEACGNYTRVYLRMPLR
jgi:hypothetical protein